VRTFSKPSPSLVISAIALFVALGGTSIAAVSFARNAGAVDGKSAVRASSSLRHAAGKLVATRRRGAHRGQIPARFLAGVAHVKTFGRSTQVVDNAPGAPVTLARTSLGTLTASCNDQNNRPGVEDPTTTIGFTNSSGDFVNVAARVGTGQATVTAQANGTLAPLTVTGSNTFEYMYEKAGKNVIVEGVVRQDGRRSPAASCLVWGTVFVAE
jgi:hypothetical protein